MRLVFTESSWDDYLWFQTHDRRLLRRINTLIQGTLRSPFEGIGKPEPLKADLSGIGHAESPRNIELFIVLKMTKLQSFPVDSIIHNEQLHP